MTKAIRTEIAAYHRSLDEKSFGGARRALDNLALLRFKDSNVLEHPARTQLRHAGPELLQVLTDRWEMLQS